MGHFPELAYSSIDPRKSLKLVSFAIQVSNGNLKMPTKGKGKGKLSPELQAKYEEAFDAIDADGAGSISKSELVAIMAADDISDAAIDECLAKFDADRDGEMDKEEYFDFVFGSMLESARGFMKAADTSGDGKLSKEELATCFANMGFPAEM